MQRGVSDARVVGDPLQLQRAVLALRVIPAPDRPDPPALLAEVNSRLRRCISSKLASTFANRSARGARGITFSFCGAVKRYSPYAGLRENQNHTKK